MKKVKASLTIEGAIVLPIIILAVCSILYFVKILYIQEQVQFAITEAAEDIAAHAYILDKTKILDNQQHIYSMAGKNIDSYEDQIDQVLSNGESLQGSINSLPSLYYEANNIISDDVDDSGDSEGTLLEQGVAFITEIVELKENITTLASSLYENGTSLLNGIKILIVDTKSYAASVGVAEGLEIINNLVGAQITKGMVNRYISDEQYEAWGIIGGKDGMDYSRSKFMLENEDVLIVVNYRLQVPFYSQIIGDIPMKQSVCVRAFTGNENFESGYKKTEEEVKENETVEYVYITKSGTKYHTKDCKHLNIQVYSTTYGEIKNEYEMCSLCGQNAQSLSDSTIVYYTENGTVFHTSDSCSYICHNGFQITKEEAVANGYTPCKTCGGGN